MGVRFPGGLKPCFLGCLGQNPRDVVMFAVPSMAARCAVVGMAGGGVQVVQGMDGAGLDRVVHIPEDFGLPHRDRWEA